VRAAGAGDGLVSAIAEVRFTVRDPLATNRVYRRRGAEALDPALAAAIAAAGGRAPSKFGGGRGMFVTAEGKAYQQRARDAAFTARLATPAWPTDPWRVAHARVGYQLYDYRGDTDGVRKACRDALEGVLYANDRVVEDGPAPLPIWDGGGRRVEVLVELLALRTANEAARLCAEHERRRIERLVRRARR
jgi:Endodeoxyribonuclease RusA